MKKSTRKNKSAVVSHSRWLGYVTAGVATAAAGTQIAEAEIHYSGLIKFPFHGIKSQGKTFRLSASSAIFFDRHINYTGTRSFSFNGANDHFHIFAANGSVAGFFYTCAYSTSVASVSNLEAGDAVSQRPFVPGGGILMTADGLGCGGGARGQFFSADVDYIGFKFDRGQGVQYGWARIKKERYPANEYVVMDYAYADSGEPILVGQKRSGRAHQPSQGSLALLALGATGLMVWRRQRSRGRQLR
jgi:hypothetical protein